MKTSNLLLTIIGLVFFSFSPSAHTNQVITNTQQLPEVACRYVTKITPNDKSIAPTKTTWFFWRNSNMVQTQNSDGQYGEVWEKTSTGNIQYRKFYPIDKTTVEYMPADMPTNNLSFDWDKLSSMLNQQEFNALKPVKKQQVLSRNGEVLEGKINDQKLEVLWLTSEHLPASIIKKDKTGTIDLQLIEITTLSTAHKKPVSVEEIDNYRQIDAADFGDMENDPLR